MVLQKKREIIVEEGNVGGVAPGKYLHHKNPRRTRQSPLKKASIRRETGASISLFTLAPRS